MTEEKLLAIRAKLKKKTPSFSRQESRRRKRLPKSWRRPRGVHSKLRLRRRGKPTRVSVGFGSPEKVRGLTREGLKRKLILAVEDLKSIGKEEIAELKAGIGNRKKLEILKEAKKLNVKFLNIKDLDATMKLITDKFEKRKLVRKEKMKKRKEKTKKKEKKEKKASQTKKSAEPPAMEEKKESRKSSVEENKK